MITIIIPLDIKHMDDLIKECNKPFIISPFAFKNNKKAISSTIEIFQKDNNDIYIFDVTSLTCEVARILNHTCIIKQYVSKLLYKTFEDGNFPNSFYNEVLEIHEKQIKKEDEFEVGDFVYFKFSTSSPEHVGIIAKKQENDYCIQLDGSMRVSNFFVVPKENIRKYN